MGNPQQLNRFIDAQQTDYERALAEIGNGRKRSHWMWYIFPQIQGLGFSDAAHFYAIKDVDEAIAFLNHPILGPRLIKISETLLALDGNNATNIMGSPDDVKLRSSMTLFANVPGANDVFKKVLQKYYNGEMDPKTLSRL